MAWREPRDWEGKEADGDDADQLGEPSESNRYSLNSELSDLFNETMPAKADATGDIFVGVGANEIEKLGIGSDEGRAYRSNGSTVIIAPAGDVLGAAYPTENENDLVVGDADGSPAALEAPSSSTEYLLSTVNGAVVWRTRGGVAFS